MPKTRTGTKKLTSNESVLTHGKQKNNTLVNLPEVIQKCIREDRAAQQELYTHTYVHLAAAVAVYCKDATDRDWVFNLGMLRIFGSLKNYRLKTNYLGWARTILVRSAIDNIRKNKTYSDHLTLVTTTDMENSVSVLNEALDSLHTEALIKAIQALPERERLIFSMYEIDGYTHKEIEKMTDIKMNTSKWLLTKARKALIEMVTASQLKSKDHGK